MAVVVNDETIEDSMIRDEAERLKPQYYEYMKEKKPQEEKEDLEKQLYEWARENLIERVLLKQAAMANPEPAPDEEVLKNFEALIQSQGGEKTFYDAIGNDPKKVEQIKDDLRTRIKVEQLVRELTSDLAPPSDSDIRKFYSENKKLFIKPELIRVKHIVKHSSTEPDADKRLSLLKEAESALDEGVLFEEVVERFSDCKDNGGDLGFFSRGEMVQSFEEIVFAMEVDEVSNIFETEFGHHIAKLYGRQPESFADFEEVKKSIREELQSRTTNAALERFIDERKEQATIVYNA